MSQVQATQKVNPLAAVKAKQPEVKMETQSADVPAEATTTTPATKKEPTVITAVKMTDGRTVNFAGKRKMSKEVMIEGSDVSVRFDFVNGQTRTFKVPTSLMAQCAGHGASQKIGDEAAGVEELDDIVIAIDDIIARLSKGEWGTTRAAGDGFSGASVVIRAIGEVTGKTSDEVKAFLEKKLADAKANGETLTRRDLYASFRNPSSKTGIVIERLERDKKSKELKVNADDLLKDLA